MDPAALAAANDLAARNLGLAHAAARRHKPKGMDADEALSLAMLALVHASRNHDPARGTLGTLHSHAYKKLLANWHKHRNAARRRGTIRNAPLGTRNPVDPRPDPRDAVDAADAIAYVRANLCPTRWALLEARYFRRELLEDIGGRLPGGPRTKELARQRIAAALAASRELLTA